MKVILRQERETKNKVRFQEEIQDTERLGMIYVPKETLRIIGWKEGKNLIIELEAEE